MVFADDQQGKAQVRASLPSARPCLMCMLPLELLGHARQIMKPAPTALLRLKAVLSQEVLVFLLGSAMNRDSKHRISASLTWQL